MNGMTNQMDGSSMHGMMGSWMNHGMGGTLADIFGVIAWLALLALVLAATTWLIKDMQRKK